MDSLVELFCVIDDFCHEFEPLWNRHLLTQGQKKRRRNTALSMSELMTLVVLFHQLRHRQFKCFYLDYACRYQRSLMLSAGSDSSSGASGVSGFSLNPR